MAKMERTLVLLKPDAVQRGLVGEIIGRFEKVGLKMAAMKMVHPTRDMGDRHYKLDEEWGKAVYDKAKSKADADGKEFAYSSWKEYSDFIRGGLIEYLNSGPTIALVFEGFRCIEIVRKIVGATEPLSSPPGTIRGDLCIHSYEAANKEGRALINLIHASSSVSDAEHEISLWFDQHELHEYRNVLEDLLYNPEYFR